MLEMSKTIHVESESELGRLLDAAAETDSVLEKDGMRYRLVRVEAPTLAGAGHGQRPPLAPERALNIIGLGASPDGSDVARLKDRYVADAAAHRGE